MIGTDPRRGPDGDGPRPVLALDVGGTKLAAAVLTSRGAPHGTVMAPTRGTEGWRSVLTRLFELGRQAIAASGFGAVHAVGIACGGPLDPMAGTVHDPPHLPGWTEVPIGPLAAEEFGVPFALQNDATAAAMAEHRFGAGRGTSTMLYLTVSTGIGGGAIVNGTPHLGSAGNAAEFGHITVRRGGRLCGCGRRGCVEAYASGTSIALRARAALAGGARSSLALLDTVTAADVTAAAEAGDELARAVWTETVDLLGCAVTDLVNVFEPELVVLGGGVTRSGSLLLDPIRQQVAREAMPPAARAAEIVLAQLDQLIGVIGAGTLAQDLIIRPDIPVTRQPGGKEAHV